MKFTSFNIDNSLALNKPASSNKDRRTSLHPAARMTLVGCLCFWVMLPLILFAQTEVEGEVSGVWTSEGNPYIVIDSTWIPEGERLTILEGVRLLFEEDQGLYVFGSIEATGSEEDSVYIRVAEGVEHWRGLRFYGRDLTEWSYASIICPDSSFVLDPSCSLTMNHCLLDADRTIAGDSRYGIRGGILTFSHSIIRSRSYHTATGGRLTANHTVFDFGEDESDEPGFWSQGTRFDLTSCEVIGALHAEGGVVYADSCRFLRPPHGRQRTGLGIGTGRMTESFVEGGAAAGRMYSRVAVPFVNNTLLGNVSLSGTVNVSGCHIGGLLDIDNCEFATVRNSTINEGLWICHNNTVIIDSCFIVSDDSTRHWFSARLTSQLTVTRSVFDKRISLGYEVDEVLFDHNTIVFDSSNGGLVASGHHSFTNNIIVADPDETWLFGQDQYAIPDFRFNCVWGFDIAAGPPDDPMPIEEIDSTNVILDPLLQWDGFIPNLSFNSPCVDRGDPEFDPDPDGSRTDIGARFFDHRLDVVKSSDDVLYPELMNISAFPNPFNNNLNISFSSLRIAPVSIRLVDMTGRAIMQTTHITTRNGSGLVSLNATSLPSGNYFLFFRNNQYTRIIPVYCVK